MALFFRPCSVCSAPPEVVAAVNQALSRKKKLRDIAKMCGISKSSIHRHSKRCLPREILSAYKATKVHPGHQRIFVQWPDDANCPADVRGKLIPENKTPTENDIVLRVCYEKGFIANPRGLMIDDRWTEDAQKVFCQDVTADVKQSYIDGQHQCALVENALRDSNQIPDELVTDQDILLN